MLTRERLEGMKRPELQAVARNFGIKASGKSIDIINSLLQLEMDTNEDTAPEPSAESSEIVEEEEKEVEESEQEEEEEEESEGSGHEVNVDGEWIPCRIIRENKKSIRVATDVPNIGEITVKTKRIRKSISPVAVAEVEETATKEEEDDNATLDSSMTRQGYVKDGFVVDDDADEGEEAAALTASSESAIEAEAVTETEVAAVDFIAEPIVTEVVEAEEAEEREQEQDAVPETAVEVEADVEIDVEVANSGPSEVVDAEEEEEEEEEEESFVEREELPEDCLAGLARLSESPTTKAPSASRLSKLSVCSGETKAAVDSALVDALIWHSHQKPAQSSVDYDKEEIDGTAAVLSFDDHEDNCEGDVDAESSPIGSTVALSHEQIDQVEEEDVVEVVEVEVEEMQAIELMEESATLSVKAPSTNPPAPTTAIVTASASGSPSSVKNETKFKAKAWVAPKAAAVKMTKAQQLRRDAILKAQEQLRKLEEEAQSLKENFVQKTVTTMKIYSNSNAAALTAAKNITKKVANPLNNAKIHVNNAINSAVQKLHKDVKPVHKPSGSLMRSTSATANASNARPRPEARKEKVSKENENAENVPVFKPRKMPDFSKLHQKYPMKLPSNMNKSSGAVANKSNKTSTSTTSTADKTPIRKALGLTDRMSKSPTPQWRSPMALGSATGGKVTMRR